MNTAVEICGACVDGLRLPFAFSMAFQPIVDVVAERVFAYEALVRGPGGEPASSVIDRVTPANRYAFDQGCRQRAIELAAKLGVAERGAKLSINFMPGAMYRPENCIRVTLAAARRHQFPLDKIIFELTEDERITDYPHVRAIFGEYRSHGFQVAIDDFGAGYAGLNLIAEYQPDIIKLDMALIRTIDQSPVRRVLVGAILDICRQLDVTAVAEGIETRAELNVLRSLGIRLCQGYLLGRPAFEALPDITL